MFLGCIAAICLVIGGAYTGFVWAQIAPSEKGNRADNLYAGVWVFVGSCLAAMACLWITKQILTY